MKKTKIICTMGPNTNDRELMKKLVENGMDIARFNFSHGDHEEQKSRMDMLKAIREEAGKPIAILLDTKGPEIRTGVIKDDKKVTLVEGQKFTLTTKDVEGDANRVSITYEGLVEDVEIGKKKVNAKSIMGMMTLGLDSGEEIMLSANGEDEEAAMSSIERYLSNQN